MKVLEEEGIVPSTYKGLTKDQLGDIIKAVLDEKTFQKYRDDSK